MLQQRLKIRRLQEVGMELRITLPDDYTLCFGESTPDLLENEIKKNNALILYKQGKISISKAAALASMSIFEFSSECKKNSIPVLDYTENEIDTEFDKIKERL